jgi:rhamnosyltransferase
MKLASCIVLYYPELVEVKKNINSYIHSVDKLYVIDNTPNPFPESKDLQNLSNKIEYLPNFDNLGIAKALNLACNKAIQEGFDWIITFDQDSWCFPNMVEKLKEIAVSNEGVGSVSPSCVLGEEFLDLSQTEEIKEVDCAITSGCLTNLEAYKKVNGFDESFFIDLVDIDFSFKLRETGYKILESNDAIMFHSLGDSKPFSITKNLKIWYSNHSPIRRYYITRNRLIFRKKYKQKHSDFCHRELKRMLKEIVKIFLFEEKKTAKAKAIFYGIFDFYKGSFGKIEREF